MIDPMLSGQVWRPSFWLRVYRLGDKWRKCERCGFTSECYPYGESVRANRGALAKDGLPQPTEIYGPEEKQVCMTCCYEMRQAHGDGAVLGMAEQTEHDGSGELAHRMSHLMRACTGRTVEAIAYPMLEHDTDFQIFLSCGEDEQVWACVASPTAGESDDVVIYDPDAEDLDAALADAVAGWISRNVAPSPPVRLQRRGLP